MHFLFVLVLLVIGLLVAPPATAGPANIKRVPLCLQFPEAGKLVPCTGVVPVDVDTGSAQSWAEAMKGASGEATVGGPAPNSAQVVGGKDIDGRVKTLSVDTNGALNVNCTGCTGGSSGTPTEQTRRAYWSESTTKLGANQTFTGMSHDNGGTIQGGPTRWNSFACFGTSDQSGTVNLQASNDNTTWFTVQSKTMSGSLPNVYLSQPMFTKYWRCQVVNGDMAQNNFLLNAAFGM